MVLPNNLTGIRKQIGNLAGNIAGAKAVGGKEQQSLFSVSYADNGKVSYVQEQTRLDILSRGPLVATGNNGDIALSKGNGMFVFKQNVTDTSDQEFRFRGTGSLRIDKDGYLSTSADGTGYKLMGYKIDENGNLPTVTSLLSSLTPVSIKDAILRPEATTSIAVNRLRLDSDKTVLHGPGDIMRIRGTLNTSLKPTDIIIPEENNFSGLKQGDRIELSANLDGVQASVFEYGGIAISKKINGGNGGFYGQNNPGNQFTFAGDGVPQTPINLVKGNGITIRFNGIDTTLTANVNGADQTFSSLTGFRDAINKFIPGLTAKIEDGRIYIAADDTASPAASNGAITFANASGGNLVETLGLVDVGAAAGGVQRFATLKTLQKRVNLNNDTTGLKADFDKRFNLDLHALIASNSFQLNGHSAGGPNDFRRGIIGAAPNIVDPRARNQAAATYSIEAPKHGLKPNDFVQITGSGSAQFPDGRYMVAAVNADAFTIYPTNPQVGNFPAAGSLVNAPAGTWQKIAGEVRPIETPTGAAAAAAGLVSLTVPVIANYAAGDIVYISGIGSAHINAENVDVPDGYYTIALPGANVINIAPAATATAAANAVYTPLNVGNVRVQKVGAPTAGAAARPNPRVMTTRAVEGVPVNTVRLFLPTTNYNIGDYFRMNNLQPGIPLAISNMLITQGADYQITNKDPNGNWIEFQPPVVPAAGVVNEDSNYGVANARDVGPNFRLDNYSLTSKYLGFQDQKSKFFPATYNKDVPTLSISNTDPQTNKHLGKVFDHAIKVVDSLGSEHELILNFARLENNRWAVEVAGIKNAEDSYDFVTQREDGVIAAGEINFDEDGDFSDSDIPALEMNWTTNGSLPSKITIDWNDALSGKGITQFRGASLAEEVTPNGHTIGTVDNFDIDENGKVYAIFDNGQRIAIYQAPVAMAANMNGLEGTADGMFIPGPLSGPMLLRIAGENGAPTVISKAYESSNIDSLKSILELNETANTFRANIAVITTDDTLTKEAIAKVGNV